MTWECVGPGLWRSGSYAARRINRHKWVVTHNEREIFEGLHTLDECKKAAQDYADKQIPIKVENYPLAGVKRVEVIDHRHGAPIYGRAYTAYEVRRAELSFQDENTTLKVFVE